MKIIIGERCSGKTTTLIMKSAATQTYILTATKERAKCLFDMARKMDLNMPFPTTVSEFLRNGYQGSSIRRDGLLIDDADDVLKTIFRGIPIHEITMTYRDNITYLEDLRKRGHVTFPMNNINILPCPCDDVIPDDRYSFNDSNLAVKWLECPSCHRKSDSSTNFAKATESWNEMIMAINEFSKKHSEDKR